ncbi:transmembrane protein 241 isoform X3 [Rhinatrema bivittatum]|uniref:transmembrane protein 241 isoform X3 n=1 Tax=Rhinatrema bivittatum TaxID=194408 RepID=UPI00112CB959|nr:transmembrane protein 241 isoform X3 [Rhinatrema bivittatum]
MYLKRPALGLVFCWFYLAAYITNKYVLSVLKFTYPTLFQGWQTLVGGLLLHISWKLGWVEISSNTRSEVLSWLPASVLFVGIIYAGSRALSKLHISLIKIWSALFLLIAASCLPLHDSQFDPDGYFWAGVHLICVGGYKAFQKSQKSTIISDLDQQYINYIFSIVLLGFASHPTGDLFSVLEFPFLYFYRFHSGCCASGILGFFLMLSTVKLKGNLSSGHCAAWTLFAKVITAGSSLFFFDMILNVPTACCLLLGGLGETLLVYAEKSGAERR